MHNHKRFKKTITAVSFLLLFCMTLLCYLYIPYPYSGKEPVLSHLIAHAGGSIGNHAYTNSREAVLQSIRNGYKYIELDFQLTSDSQLVCMHSANDFRQMTAMADSTPLTANYFRQQRIIGKYTPITATDVTALMYDHPFILVTDKISSPELINKYFSMYKEQMLVPAFSLDDYRQLKELGFTPMLQIYYNGIKKSYIISCLKLHSHIEWICTSIYSQEEIQNCRILKRLFGIKIVAFSPVPELYLQHVGHEIDLLYIDKLPNL